MADVEPDLRRHIVRDQLGMWIIAFVVFGLVMTMVFGGIDFGNRANAVICIIVLVGFIWWAWRSWRQRNIGGQANSHPAVPIVVKGE